MAVILGGRGNVHNILVTGVVGVFVGRLLVDFAEDGSQEANIKTLGDAGLVGGAAGRCTGGPWRPPPTI